MIGEKFPMALHVGVGVANLPSQFRSEGLSTQIGGSAVFVKLALVLIIGLIAVWAANRKGWLDRWKSGRSESVGLHPRRALMRLDTLRLGSRTVIHRLRDGEREFLLIESSANILLGPAGACSEGSENVES